MQCIYRDISNPKYSNKRNKIKIYSRKWYFKSNIWKAECIVKNYVRNCTERNRTKNADRLLLLFDFNYDLISNLNLNLHEIKNKIILEVATLVEDIK